MNIGWIFLICALIILVSMALIPWWKKEHVGTRQAHISGANQHVSARLDALDARLTRREEITRLLREGQKINAIKMYRECTGASLAEARAGVERIELAVRLDPAAPGELPIPALPGQAVDTLEREVEALVMRGKKIEAIKLYREQTGLDLREARDAVDLIEQALLTRSATTYQVQPGDPDTENTLPVVETPGEEVRRYVLDGKKIQAIKLYREQTGLSLREAREAIDRLEQAMHQGMEHV